MPFDVPVVRAGWLACVLAGCSATSLDLPMEGDGSGGSTTNGPPPTTSPDDTSTTGPGVTSTSGPPPATSGLDTSDSSTWGSGPSDDGGGTFLPPPGECFVGDPGQGWVSHCTPPDCDVFEQDCPRDEKCMPWANDGGHAWNASRCSPVDRDPVPPGGTCTALASPVSGIDDCAANTMCWGVDPATLEGTCIPFCDPQLAGSCAAETECVELNEGTMAVCLATCNPLDEASCPAGEACRNAEEERFHCLPVDGGHVTESSEHCDETTCPASQFCVVAEGLGSCDAKRCCTDLCDLGDPDADAQCAAVDPLLACVPFYEPGMAPAGLEAVGICLLPS